jgi:lipopolysaccharide/colanic/teichoic acid biosynthesis glycosyltransferase
MQYNTCILKTRWDIVVNKGGLIFSLIIIIIIIIITILTSLYPQQLALTSPTSGGRSVGIVRSRTDSTDFFFIL